MTKSLPFACLPPSRPRMAPVSASAWSNAAAASAVALALSLAGATGLVHAADPGYACLIEPFQRVELRSPVEARIDAIHVNRGTEVRKGQVLVELDTSTERIALEGARYRAVMEGQVRSAESKLVAAKEKYRRRDELVKERFMAAQDRDDSKADMQMAEASLVEARDNRRLADIEQRRLAEMVEQRRLKSPFNGIVTERLQQVGEIAQGGNSARPILRLAQTNPLRVEVVLPVAMYGKVKAGSKAQVQAEPPLSGRYDATVTVVDKVIDSASGTFGVRLEIANPKGDIPAGIKCRTLFQ